MTNSMLAVTNAATTVAPVVGDTTMGTPALWMVIVASVFGGITLLFLMLLVLIEVVFGRKLDRESRFLVVSIIAMGLALSGGFLGGSGQMTGAIPLPQLLKNPLNFGITGGAAVFAVIWTLGYWLYVRGTPLAKEAVTINFPAGTPLSDAIVVAAAKHSGGACSVEFLPDEPTFRGAEVAEGEVSARSAVELVNMLQKHLAKGAIQYATSKPKNQNRITVKQISA